MIAKLIHILAFSFCNLTGNTKSTCMAKAKSVQAKYMCLILNTFPSHINRKLIDCCLFAYSLVFFLVSAYLHMASLGDHDGIITSLPLYIFLHLIKYTDLPWCMYMHI